jgi:ABC-type nickel/cobalt efflux system permease component RcnA
VLDSILLGVIAFGFLHGINPSHGWTVAMLYSTHSRKPLLSSFTSSGIIAGAHFISSIAVVVAYIFLDMFIEIPQLYMQYGVAIALGILAYIFWKEKGENLIETQHGHLHDNIEQLEHEHAHWHEVTGYHSHMHIHQLRTSPSLKAIASFAFVLGFAHEEEFVILALAVGGIDPLMLMVAYASSVTIALIGITMIAVKAYTHIQYRFIQYSKFLPKITALVLAVMAIGFAIGIF